jgi:hypothetical protein
MSKRTVEAFVRAKPKEISITETYRYTAEISDNDHLSFEGASGDIKVKFFYDGQGFHWKFPGFLNRWLPPLRLRKRWVQLFGWIPLSWLSSFLKTRTNQKEANKCFDIAAIEDAKKYVGKCSMARVGHLALRGYQRPNFEENWPESKTLQLQIPIDDFERKLIQSQKYEISCTYPLQKPERPLLSLDEVILSDTSKEDLRASWRQSDGNFGRLHSKSDEELHLTLNLSMEGGDPELDADDQIPRESVMAWWKEYKKKQSEKLKEKKSKKAPKKQKGEDKNEDKKEEENNEDNLPIQGQIICLEGFSSSGEIKKALKYLASKRGGYLLIRLEKSDDIDSLKEQVLRSALASSIPILAPYKHADYRPNKKPLVVVPVPMKPEDTSTYRPIHLSLKSDRSIIEVNEILEDVPDKQLAIHLSAIANTANGKLGLSTSSTITNIQEKDDLKKTLSAKLFQAANYCHPQMYIPSKSREMIGDKLLVKIRYDSYTIYTVEGIAYIWKDGQPKELSVDETYKFFKDRFALQYPLITPSPFISHAQIDWFYFDPREADGVRYDPQKKVIKWSSRVLFRQTPDHRFEVELPLQINRPIELYRRDSVCGKIHLELGNNLKSGLKTHYFDTLGRQVIEYEDRLPKIQKKSKIELDFDINLDAIFRRRKFTTLRVFEFEGVRPGLERLEELQAILADLGLEEIQVDYRAPWLRSRGYSIIDDEFMKRTIESEGYVVEGHRPPNLNVTLHVKGKFKSIYRERKQGERADKMRVYTGNLQILVEGSIQNEPSQNLSVLLNRLQQLLTERFSHIGAQVA